LDIKSPIDGVVISGDLKRAEGAPVAIGQTLYEIAPLDRMVAEVAIPDDEISRVRLAQSVTINLDA
jgi:multidrug resistance efflux pump